MVERTARSGECVTERPHREVFPGPFPRRAGGGKSREFLFRAGLGKIHGLCNRVDTRGFVDLPSWPRGQPRGDVCNPVAVEGVAFSHLRVEVPIIG